MREREEEVEQAISSIFPRLHVNEAEKGGLRGPPMNKMALYEQFSIPIYSGTMLPLPNNDSGRLLPSTSWSDVGTHHRSILTSYCNSPMPSHLSKKTQSFASSEAKLHTTMTEYKRISPKPSDSQILSSTGPSSSAANSDSFQPNVISNCRYFPLKKIWNEDVFRVPISSQVTTLPCRNSQYIKGKDKLPSLIDPLRLKGDRIKQINGSNTIVLKSRQSFRNQDEVSRKACQSNEDLVESSASLTIARVKDVENISSSPSSTVERSELLKRKHAFMSQETRSTRLTDLNNLHCFNGRFDMESLTVHNRVALKDDNLVGSRIGSIEKMSVKGITELYLRPSIGNENWFSNELEKGSENCEKNCGVVQVGIVDRHEEQMDRTVVDSISPASISPDDVIGVIGEKQFCETRKAIINQQRVFAVQVFELHRLITVQRLIAGSSDLLLDDNPLMRRPSMKVSIGKKAPIQRFQEPSLEIFKSNDHTQKSDSSTESAGESTVGKFPLPLVNIVTSSRGPVKQQSNYGQYFRKSTLNSEAADRKPPLWPFQLPPGNVWLVPVMSPSEGLTYKSYTGPCPPTGGFMAPMYAGCDPVGLNPGNKNYLNAAYGVPASYQQGMGISTPLHQINFPPYSSPVNNPCILENQLYFPVAHQSSCNMSSQAREVMSCFTESIRVPTENELQGTAPGSPSDRKCNVLPLFPTAPQAEEPSQNAQRGEHQTRVIKVIPHSFRSATESAARIFLSIQEERK